jgi:hypothetical protein
MTAGTNLGVNEPEHRLGICLGDTLLLKVLGDGLCDSDSGRSSSEEEDPLVLERDARDLKRADRSGEDDGARTLDVVVEARVVVAVLGEDGERERRVEVLELDDHIGEIGVHLLHEGCGIVRRLVGERSEGISERTLDEDLGRQGQHRFTPSQESYSPRPHHRSFASGGVQRREDRRATSRYPFRGPIRWGESSAWGRDARQLQCSLQSCEEYSQHGG